MDWLSEWLSQDVESGAHLALFALRLVVGFLFVVSFNNKRKDIKGFAKGVDLPVPAAWLLIFAELSGGVGIILGVWTQLAALGLMLIMIGSTYYHLFKWRSPYWAAKGGWEYDLMIFVMMAVIFTVGGGDIAFKPYPSAEWLPFYST